MVMDDEQVRHAGLALEDREHHHDDADHERRDHGNVIEPRADGNALAHGPEHEHGVDRILHGRAETDDGKRADHAHGKCQVVVDEHQHEGRYQREHDEAQVEVARIHDAAERLFINKEDEQAHKEGDHKCQDHLQGAERDGKDVGKRELVHENLQANLQFAMADGQ